MKIFVIDFSGKAAFIENFPDGHQIAIEDRDGAAAYKMIGEQLPDKIFINYGDKPSHGRQTAIAIKKRKATSAIPIYFVNGSEDENKKADQIGHCIMASEINKCL
ncbi:MAG TPA: hypothetical protein VFR70_11500 [Flavobacterium sp.]|nr:hypothetical protein [Flavobacterium sp.]